MAKPPPLRAPSTEPPLDRALAAAAAGDSEGALRWAVPLVKADLAAPAPIYVLGHELVRLGEAAAGKIALEVAVDRAVDSGNLPVAIAALAALRGASAATDARASEMARTYAKGSPRLRPGATTPPTGTPDVSPLPATLADGPLLVQASEVVDYARAALDADREKRAKPPQVPLQSLFSSFGEDALRALSLAFDARLVQRGDKVIEQGAIGAEAFVLARGELEVLREQPEGEPVLLARLGNGAVFGEMALLSRAPRAASVVAARPSIVLWISVARLEEVAAGAPEVGTAFAAYCHRRMVANLVRTSPLLGPLSAGERQALIERFASRSFEAGTPLILQGKESDGLHVIASGQVRVVRHDGEDEVAIAALGVGEVVGEVSLVFRRPSNADVIAEHPTLTLFLPRARFMEIVREHPTLLSQLYTLAVVRDEETASIAAQEAADAEDLII
jgi:cAMP-dependent protein kinase regulator